MRKFEQGMTLAEAMAAVAITGVLIIFSTRMLTTAYRGTQDNINKQFATQKAVSMLEELRALIQAQDGANATLLDDYDDGVTNQIILTTQRSVTDPASPASGNTRHGSGWLFSRRVTVQKMPGAPTLRLVNVKVFVNDVGGERLLAEVASVLTTLAVNSPPTQVYDVYLVAIENVPGWWVYMQDVVPFVDGAMQDLETRHPGLQFRKHWIRKLSYGRDPYYTPFVNSASDSTQPINSVYFYPGRMPNGSSVDAYYPPDFFSGRIRVDANVVNGQSATNALPYSLADQYNNAMRHADEESLFNLRVAAGLESADAPTFRLLLDDMYLHPGKYRNAIVINLHGELYPFPPVRNYSDAAKDPGRFPYVRAVTHPEQIHYGNSDAVKLRVCSYHTRTGNPGAVAQWLTTPITVVIRNLQWTPSPANIVAITGGVDFDNDGNPDNYSAGQASVLSSPTSAPTRMWWSSTISGSDTILRLYNSPLKAPCVGGSSCNNGGLTDARKLYGLEYIPSPVENMTDAAATPFGTTLATAGDVEKNTARWVITIPDYVLTADRRLTIETHLGDPNDPDSPLCNASNTYVWRGSDPWLFGDATHDPNLPITERFQILGDPRHCPYADLKSPHQGSSRARENPLGMGYNRYFDDFDDGASAAAFWPGWSYKAPLVGGQWYGVKNNSADSTPDNDGWDTGSGMLEIDVPRIFQITRSALTRANAIYTTMTGFSYFYLGIGGEIGYDASNGFTNSIPVSSKPFDGSTNTRNEQSITNARVNGNTAPIGGVKYVRENASGSYWWSMSWLGELYPDSQWNTWSSTGNLPTGTGGGTFSRVLRSSVTPNLPAGTALTDAVRRTAEEGSTTFFWSGSTNSTFHHRYQDNTNGDLDTDGTAVSNTYKIPLAASIPNSRPFDINVDDTGMNPNHFLQPVYGSPATLETLSRFYRHSSGLQGSSMLAMRDGTRPAFVVVNGLSPTGQSGVAFISRWSFLSLIYGFFDAGLLSTSGQPDAQRVRQLPRVEITQPNDQVDLNNPGSIHIEWNQRWSRWDTLPYTPSYPNNWSDDTTIRYAVIYSRDNGRTWLHVEDDAPVTTPGVRPAAAYLRTGASYDWNVPAARFPRGNYVIRVEAYRDEVPLHYAFHQYRAFVKR